MEYSSSYKGYWYNWLTATNDELRQSGVTNPQPKNYEGFLAEAKSYNDEANEQAEVMKREKDDQKQKERLLKQQAKTALHSYGKTVESKE